MIKVKNIKEKVELKDMEINSDPCKIYYEKYDEWGKYDCEYDCAFDSAMGSGKF